MDVVVQPSPKSYNLSVTLADADVKELRDSLAIIPKNLVAVRELVSQITNAAH